jgi:tetratricopeptide (TPR) repeat protein
VAGLVIVVCGLLVYANSLQCPFVFDDVWDIQENVALRSGWQLWRAVVKQTGDRVSLHSRPVVVLSFAANYAMSGANVVFFHATNLLIHLSAGLTLYGIVRRTLSLPSMRIFDGAANPLALVIALVWTLHPLQTSAVTYVVQRYESMMGLFYLLTLYAAIRLATDERYRVVWLGACVTACLLAMGCKEVAISAPLMVLLYDRAFIAGSFRAAWRDRKSLYLGLALTWLVFIPFYRRWSGGGGGESGFAGFSENKPWDLYALNQPTVILHYLRLSVWPEGQCLDYAWRATRDLRQVGPAIVAVAALLAITIYWTARRPAWGFLGDWFFLILAPSSSFVPINDLACEYRMYLPLASVVVAVVLVGYRLLRVLWPVGSPAARPVFLGLSMAAVIALGAATVHRNFIHSNVIRLLTDVLAISPYNPRTILELAGYLGEEGRTSEALAYLESLEQQNSILQRAYWQIQWGVLLMRYQHGEKAIPHFLEAARLDPQDVDSHLNLAGILASHGCSEAALAELMSATELQPDLVNKKLRADDLQSTRIARMVDFVTKSCGVDPAKLSERSVNRALAASQMGIALSWTKKDEAALGYFNLAEKLDPSALSAEARRAKEEALRRLAGAR